MSRLNETREEATERLRKLVTEVGYLIVDKTRSDAERISVIAMVEFSMKNAINKNSEGKDRL